MNLHYDLRGEDDFAFYINGDLQFDTRDEAIYHESLALPALCLAARRKAVLSASPALRVLICGGGDGLALRECLRFPKVAHVDLVDYSADVVQEGRERFAGINGHAFDDPRAHVHIADAWQFLQELKQNETRQKETRTGAGQEPERAESLLYDAVICDFTVPQRDEDTRVFSREWYALAHGVLAPHGLLAMNAVSPQTTPEAFWCLRNTLQSAHFTPLPYRVCIPSFRAQGYGVWAFMLAGARLRREELRDLHSPIPTRQADLTELWRGAHFGQAERRQAKRIPPHTLDKPVLLSLLLNPGGAFNPASVGDVPGKGRPSGEQENGDAPYSLNALLRAIPISHPYHTRAMIETLAAQVVGTVRHLDIQRLVAALLKRAQSLPQTLCQELRRLQTFLQNRMPRLEMFGQWGRKLFVTLVILMTLANSIAPDNAFAKGSFGSHGSFGHTSMSRGYSGSSFGGHESGFSSGGRSASGSSFGGSKSGYGGSFGSEGRAATGSFGSAPSITSSGFRRGSHAGGPVDIEGYAYTPRSYIYRNWGYGHSGGGGGVNNINEGEGDAQHQAVFVADDDLLVMDNGDCIIPLSDTAYLLVSGSSLSLMSQQQPAPLRALYPDPNLFQSILQRLQERQAQANTDIQTRRDWLAWVGWTSALSGTVAGDKTELANLEDLGRRLQAALDQIKVPSVGSAPAAPPEPNGVELFADCLLLPSGRIALCGVDDAWMTTDGKHIAQPGHAPADCPPDLTKSLQSVLAKLEKEFAGDVATDDNDLQQLATEKTSLESDLNEYNRIAAQNSDPSYEVDYGTEEIGVGEAIRRTQSDQADNAASTTETQADRDKTVKELERVRAAIQHFGK